MPDVYIIGKKRKSEERSVPQEKCRSCEKMMPACQSIVCSRERHYGCISCLRMVSEKIAFEELHDFNAEIQGLNCFRRRCTGAFVLG